VIGTAIAQAQTTVSDEEIIRYARSVLQMEIYRTEAYTEIKDLLLTVNVDIKDVTLVCTESDLPGVPSTAAAAGGRHHGHLLQPGPRHC
jgi:hypothetical protein